MLLLFLNTRIMCRTHILHCTVMIGCFVLQVIYWGFRVVGWWDFLDRDNGIVQWWLLLPFFHDSCCLHSFVMTMSLYLSNLLLHVLFHFRWFRHFCALVGEHKSIVSDVFTSHNLLAVLLLTTPHCQWCIYSYPSLSTSLQIHFLARRKHLELRFCRSARFDLWTEFVMPVIF
jgi:hypothetical protein